MKNIRNFSLAELKNDLIALGEPGFRASQVAKWLYQKRVAAFSEMKNISKESQLRYAETFVCHKLILARIIESPKGDAVKFGFALEPGDGITESVLLIDGDRRTLCVSSQLGCALGCVFCATAKMGFIRNLTLSEIIGQLVGTNDYLEEKGDRLVTNIVFMGMGEALGNFETFIQAIEILQNKDAFNIGGRRITVSTAGVIPYIEKFTQQELNIRLAISLNTYNNEKRSQIMPVNKAYPLEKLMEAARAWTLVSGLEVTFEYVMVAGDNDTPEALTALVNLLRGMPCKLNLIPLNPGGSTEMHSPNDITIGQFAEELHKRGIMATIRKSRGQDISGACGQLSGSYEKK